MAIQTFNNTPRRVNTFKGEVLAHADTVNVLGIVGSHKTIPKNSGDTVTWRRWLPLGGIDNKWITGANVNTYAPDHLLTEGVTPSADILVPVDVTAQLKQYGCLYAVTDKQVDLGEDDVPAEMKVQVGQRVGLLREMVIFGAIKGITNVYYGGTGLSPSTVNGTISIPMLRRITKNLKSNHAKMVTGVLSSSGDFGTVAVEASYLVFTSTDMEPAIRDLPGFKHRSEYGSGKVVHPQEIGSVESFRFVLSPELAQNVNAGAAVGSTGLSSTGGANIDIYPMIVTGEDAWGQVALRGMDSVDVTYLPPGQKDKIDPLGQKGYVGAKIYMASAVLNNGWAALAWVGTPDLVG